MRSLSLKVFLVCVGVNAAIAIAVILSGDIGDNEGRVLFTSLCLSGAALLSLACMAGREAVRLGPLQLVGTAGAVAGFGVLIASMWVEPSDDVSWPWRLAGTLLVPAVAVAITNLLALVPVPHRWRWTSRAAVALTCVLAGMAVAALWGEFESSAYWRAFAVLSVGLAALVVAIPVLHRSGRRELTPPGSVGFCPRCGHRHRADAETETTCPHCGTTFTVGFGRPAGRGEPSPPRTESARG